MGAAFFGKTLKIKYLTNFAVKLKVPENKFIQLVCVFVCTTGLIFELNEPKKILLIH